MSETIAGVILYDLPEVSKKLNLSVRALRDYIKSARIQAKKIGNKYYITDFELKRYLTAS